MMRAISLWQPWASLWCSSRKVHETRHWPTTYRGWLLVHAAKRFERDVDPDLAAILEDEYGGHWGMDLPTGALIGRVDLVACLPTDALAVTTEDRTCGDHAPGRFAWRRSGYELFARPIPYRGAQGFFAVPDAVLAAAAIPIPAQGGGQGSLFG